MSLQNPKLLIGSIILSQLAGIIGSLATAPAIETWYTTLTKPAFNPPNWLFAPVWTILYTLMGISLYLIWVLDFPKLTRPVKLFLIHLIINTLWSLIFFGLKDLLLGLIVILILWGFIAYLIYLFWHLRRPAAYLLIPYLLWVIFATLLNFSLWQLNTS